MFIIKHRPLSFRNENSLTSPLLPLLTLNYFLYSRPPSSTHPPTISLSESIIQCLIRVDMRRLTLGRGDKESGGLGGLRRGGTRTSPCLHSKQPYSPPTHPTRPLLFHSLASRALSSDSPAAVINRPHSPALDPRRA